jgi:hypothetical protein
LLKTAIYRSFCGMAGEFYLFLKRESLSANIRHRVREQAAGEENGGGGKE